MEQMKLENHQSLSGHEVLTQGFQCQTSKEDLTREKDSTNYE